MKWKDGQNLLKISEFFYTYGFRTIDLREVDQDDTNSGSTTNITNTTNSTNTATESLDNRLLRYQYDGDLTLREPIISKDEIKNMSCTTLDLPDSCTGKDKSCSNHVVRTGQYFVSQVLLVNELVSISDTPEVTCDIIENGTTATLINNLGLDPVRDSEYLSKLKKSDKYSNDFMELVTKCTGSGCSVKVIHDIDEVTQMKSRARVEELFIAGRPTVDDTDGHRKSLSIRAKSAEHEFRVVVTGDYEVPGKYFCYSLPKFD